VLDAHLTFEHLAVHKYAMQVYDPVAAKAEKEKERLSKLKL
jgi:hypothetical protein